MKTVTIALLGNPNCGKSTLFNALTGGRSQVGNWPGVTVERKSGTFCESGITLEVIDLPGTYSLTSVSAQQAIDEQIACETIAKGDIDLVVNVVDVNNLQRQLYLTSQLLAMDVPVVLAVNRVDLLQKHGAQCDYTKLAQLTGCLVVPLCASKKHGITELKQTIIQALALKKKPFFHLTFPDAVERGLVAVQSLPGTEQRWRALQVLSGDTVSLQRAGNERSTIDTIIKKIEQEVGEEADILIAGTRYSWAASVEAGSIHRDGKKIQTPQKSRLDQWLLHRFLGIPFFLLAMYLMFLFAINIGGALQDFFDKSSEAIFVTGSAQILQMMKAPEWLIAIIANGAGRGINTTLAFIPVIGAMFFFLAILESSGYMTRSAFVVDRLMRVMGLPGKSFVPMIVGFGCNVPAVLAARTIENHRDRILTIMMSPFMSCGARLAIFALFTAAFFPVGGQNIVFALYLIGILMAVLTGLALRKTVLQGKPEPLVMEMPPYHLPSLVSLLRPTWYHLKNFLIRAGKVIVPVCMILGALNSMYFSTPKNTHPQTVLATLGQVITPVFRPMGISDDNWPATVGLLTGVLAKEVVVGTLNTLYSQDEAIVLEKQSVLTGLKMAVLSIPENVIGLASSIRNPVLASAPIETSKASVFGVMYERFGGQTAAFSYLLFVLLYVPCISVTAAMARELNRRWALFSVLWTTGVAYATAVIFYQFATISEHVISSLAWIVSLSLLFAVVLMLMRRHAFVTKGDKKREVLA